MKVSSRKRQTTASCKPDDKALKTFFLGPQAENIDQVSEVFAHLIYRWSQYRRSCFPGDGAAISSEDQSSSEFQVRRKKLLRQLDHLIDDFENEIPKFSPRYLGHMVSEISLPALYASFLALLHNPNNISEEASRVGLKIERSAIQSLLKMVGYRSGAAGHFTSCGTIANFEAVIRARAQMSFDRPIAILLPKHAHYSWEKIAITLGKNRHRIYWIELDRQGKLDANDLDRKLQDAINSRHSLFMVVSVLGTTEFGICDPIDRVSLVLKKWKKRGIIIWHHIDAAYGGFFSTLKSAANSGLSSEVHRSLKSLSRADSITIDPHKLGYVPYASGCFLCRSRALYQMVEPSRPYIANHRGKNHPSTFEGSRSAAGALSIALTSKSLPFTAEGFGRILKLSLQTRDKLLIRLRRIGNLHLLPSRDLNILSFAVARNRESTRKVSERTRRIYRRLSPNNSNASYFVTKTMLDEQRYRLLFKSFVKQWDGKIDSDLEVIRLCLMNPFLISKEPRVDYLNDFVKCIERVSRQH